MGPVLCDDAPALSIWPGMVVGTLPFSDVIARGDELPMVSGTT